MNTKIFNSCRTASVTYRRSLLVQQRRQISWNAPKDEQAKPSTSTANSDGAPEEPQQPKDESAAPGPSVVELQDKLKAKEAEVSDTMSKLRYLQADFLNLQRNSAREKEQQKDFAITRFAGDLLNTVDVLALAIKSIPSQALVDESNTPPSSATPVEPFTPSSSKSASAYLKELHEGVDLTHRMLLQTLFKYQVKPFDPTGDVFDPNKHEALYQAVVPGKTGGTVIDCQKVGYLIRDRVLRAAQVGVAQEPPS